MDRLVIHIYGTDQNTVYQIAAHLVRDEHEGASIAGTFRNPLESHELNELQCYMDLNDNDPHTTAVKEKLEEWGKKLFEAIFNGALRGVYRSYCDDQGVPPPIHLWIEVPELWVLPWELLRDPERNWYLALSTSVMRSMRQPALEAINLCEELPLKVLYIAARPDDANFIDLTEPRIVLKALSEIGTSIMQGAVHIDLLRPPTYEQFLNRIQRGYHVIHFDGHGFWDSDTNQGALCFESPPNQQGERNMHPILAEELQNALMGSDVRLLVLSACSSGQPNRVNAYSSIAHAALNANVPAVLAMRYSIDIHTAHVFHKQFYQALVEGQTVEGAVLIARKQVQGIPQHLLQDWLVPILYQQSSSVRLLDNTQKQIELSVIPCTVPKLDTAFVGRDWELLEVDRSLMLDGVSTITLTGMPGIGKTSLALALVDWLKQGNAYPGGYFWHDFEAGGTADRIVDEMGDALMGNDWAQEVPGNRMQIIQKYLSEKPALLIWDSFEVVLQGTDENVKKELLEFLRKLPSGSRALVTSRRSRVGLVPLTKEKTVTLSILSQKDAEELTWLNARTLEVTDRLLMEKDKLPIFLDAVGYHPLGINLAIPQLALRGWTLAELIRNLKESVETLVLDEDLYSDSDSPERLRKVAASFQLSYDALSEDIRTMAPKLAAAFPGEISDLSTNVMLDIEQAELNAIAVRLHTHNLIMRRSLFVEHYNKIQTIWFFHPLLRTFIASKLSNPDEWRQRVAMKYKDLIQGIHSKLETPDYSVVLTIVDVEEQNLLYYLSYYEDSNDWDSGSLLIQMLRAYYNIRGRWYDREQILLHGTNLATRQQRDGATDEVRRKGTERLAIFVQNLGTLYAQWGRLDDAEKYHLYALKTARELGRKSGEVASLCGLGNIAIYRKEYDRATEYCEQILAMYEASGDEEVGAKGKMLLATANLNRAQRAADDNDRDTAQRCYANARALYQESFEMFQRIGDQTKLDTILGHLGIIADEATSDRISAERYYRDALRISVSVGNQPGIALCCGWLATFYADLGRHQEAVSLYVRAISIIRRLGDTRNFQVNLLNAANLLRRIGKDRFIQLCHTAANEPGISPNEVNAFLEDLSTFLE